MNEMNRTNKDLGYDNFFESNRRKLGLDNEPVARVTSEQKGAYTVINQNGEFFAKITGKRMHTAAQREDYPAVGDWVAIKELGEGLATITDILPRKTMIKRKYGDKNKTGEKTGTQIIAANIDVALIVEAVDRDYSLNRLERYIVLARDGGVNPAIVINKTDLIPTEELDAKLGEIRNRFSDLDIIPTSTASGEGLVDLRAYVVPGTTYCFLGSSGVGKSSLVNALIGAHVTRTGEISSYSGRGKHVTTNREMYFLENGSIVIDNPGMREVGMTDAGVGIDSHFDEIAELGASCKYRDCTHIHESGCAVLSALKSGTLDEGKYLNYINLKKEAEHYELSEFEKRGKDRAFGKFMKTAKKELKRYKY